MFATGRFNLGNTSGLTLPQESVVMRDGFAYVFKVGADNRVSQVKVKLGRRIDRRVEILSDVSPSDTIAESGAGFLTNADLVSVRNTANTAPATSPASK
jgi:multidrug efflux pump subunit AcrA (membrane-fusion protein)